MWNIRSHARRFPVHTGTLTPSIAHPNRFLNHLKRFSAGFLTFRSGKIKNNTVLGAESTIWNARRICFAHHQRKNYFYFGATERLRALRCSIFTGGVVTANSRCRACFRWKRRCGGKGLRMRWNPLSHALRRASSPEGGAYLLQTVRYLKAPPSGELANPQGLTERVKPLPFFQSLRPCSTWNNFTVRRLRWECAPYTRYTRPSLPDGR